VLNGVMFRYALFSLLFSLLLLPPKHPLLNHITGASHLSFTYYFPFFCSIFSSCLSYIVLFTLVNISAFPPYSGGVKGRDWGS